MTVTEETPGVAFQGGAIAGSTPSQSTAEPIVAVKNLSVEFATDHGYQRVLNDVSFDIRPGEILGVVGESGSGKSVTSLAMMGLLPKRGARISGGEVTIDGVNMRTLPNRELSRMRGRRVAMIFQEPMSSLNPGFTIGEQIAEMVRRHTGVNRREARRRAVAALDEVGIPNAADRVKRYPHEFSGGMRQRAMIAMAVSCQPKVLIADEPTTALDVTIQDQILRLLRSMCEEHGLAMMFVTHNMGVVADICDNVAVMYAGEIVEHGQIDTLFRRPLHPYTEGLLRAVPHLYERNDLISIPGTTPPPWGMPPGCRFEPRCTYALDACSTAKVPLDKIYDRATRCIRSDELVLGRVK